jgi:hypothetical protein
LTSTPTGVGGSTDLAPGAGGSPAAGAGFESDDPTQASSGGSGVTTDAAGGTSSSATGGQGTSIDTSSNEAVRAIVEADIIQVQGDQLYALSNYGGLSVVDISAPDNLRLLGRYSVKADPFEMYVRDGVAYAMYSSFPRYQYDAATGYYQTITSSRLLAIDARDPAAMRPIGSFDMPGAVSDSRMVGDVVYVVSYENGSCWGCAQNQPRTTVTSINVRDPAAISPIDQLTFDDQQGTYGYYRRSISVTTEHLYVSGMVYDGTWGTDTGHSTIQVVDISDPDGDLVAGAQVAVAGQIESRWQMDEYQGVLRVLSQAGTAWTSGPAPTLETFTVTSATEIVPLGTLTLTLPQRENLQSVRFDGPRAYAVTFQRTDPLFTIDLADPAAPKQAGEVQMPGFLYHMEPRGDRLIALGLDSGNASGGLTVSIFDVADLTRPALLSRANFGGSWGWLPEDQDRIHKAFKIFDEIGLIAMPFSGWSYSTSSCGTYTSGVQLFDFTRDTVTARGVVPVRGQAKRAFLHRERLFAVSDDQVASYDITERDAPVRLDTLPQATIADKTVRAGDYLVSLGLDWWTSAPQLAVTPVVGGGNSAPIASFDLSPVLDPTQNPCLRSYWSSFYRSAELFVHGSAVYVVYDPGFAANSSDVAGKGSVGFAVLDITDPAQPKLAGTRVLPIGQAPPPVPAGSTDSYYYYRYYYYYGFGMGPYAVARGIWPSGRRIVQVGSTVVLEELVPIDPLSLNYWQTSETRAILHAVDLSDPADIRLASSTTLSEGVSAGGLFSDGQVVMTSTYERVPDRPGRVRFQLERVDYTTVSAPQRTRINVPGSLLGVDAGAERVVTIDYVRSEQAFPEGVYYPGCASPTAFGTAFYQYATRQTDAGVTYVGYPTACVLVARSLKLVELADGGAKLLDTFEPTGDPVKGVLMGTDRIWLQSNQSSSSSGRIETITGIRAGDLVAASSIPVGYWSTLRAADTKVAVLPTWAQSDLVVYDTADPSSPVEALRTDLGLPYYSVRDVLLDDGYAVVSAGYYGAWAVPLP